MYSKRIGITHHHAISDTMTLRRAEVLRAMWDAGVELRTGQIYRLVSCDRMVNGKQMMSWNNLVYVLDGMVTDGYIHRRAVPGKIYTLYSPALNRDDTCDALVNDVCKHIYGRGMETVYKRVEGGTDGV